MFDPAKHLTAWCGLLALAGILGLPMAGLAEDGASSGSAQTRTLSAAPLSGGSKDVVKVQTRWNQPKARAGAQRVLAVIIDIDPGYHINPRKRDIPKAQRWLVATKVSLGQSKDADPSSSPSAKPDQTKQATQGKPAKRTKQSGKAQIAPPRNNAAVEVGPAQFPKPQTIKVNYTNPPQEMAVYKGHTVVYIPVIVNDSAKAGTVELPLSLRVQSCDDKRCLRPQTITRAVILPILGQSEGAQSQSSASPANPRAANHGDLNAGSKGQASPSADAKLFKGFDNTIFARMRSGNLPTQKIDFYFFKLAPNGLISYAMLFLIAAFGGLLLNFTPCVLPVIPLKVMSLSKSAGSYGKTLGLALTMAVGVIGFWLAIGVAVSSLAGFDAVNDLFKNAWFTIGVGIVIAVLAVGMCGLFSVQLPGWVYRISPSQDGFAGSLGFGVMTAVLSTPCTAPFMGAAAGWATQQSPVVSLATFAAIGTGMAVPYVLLAAIPSLINRLPRTGPGSELIKQIMGLLMLAAAAFFVGVGISSLLAQPLQPPTLVYYWLVAGFIAAAGLWLIIRINLIANSSLKRVSFSVLGAAAIALALFAGFRLTDRGPIAWTYYTPSRFKQALSDDHVVVMDFTAAWCLNCKELEHRVLFSDQVSSLLAEDDITPMKVDLTDKDSNQAGAAKLEAAGRVTIPLLVVYNDQGEEVFKADYYTAKRLVDAVNRARDQSLTKRD